MSKGSKARFAFTEGQDTPRASNVNRVQGLRRSSAASAQDHSPRRERSRSAGNRAAIRRGY
jgi:hypothetical protein